MNSPPTLTRFSRMASVDGGEVPGTTLKNLIEQNGFLSECVEMIRRRAEIDRQYTKNLRELRASANPQWTGSAVQPIVGPFLVALDKEIDLRGNATSTLFNKLNELPHSPPIDRFDDEEIAPTIKYKEIETYYEGYLHCFQAIKSPESIKSLQAWYQRPRVVKDIMDMTANEIEAYIFPEIERKYRESVVNQRSIAQGGLMWHKNHLPRFLETHQQRLEDIKSILDSVAMEYSRLSLQLVQVFAAMTNAISNISSSKHIAPLHVSLEQEMEHESMQPVTYYNFYTEEEAARPLFGLPLSEDYIKSLPILSGWTGDWVPLSIDNIFELEKKTPEASYIEDFGNREGKMFNRHYVVAFFFSIPPIMHLQAGLLTRSSERWTRNRLVAPMKTIFDRNNDHLKQTLAHFLSYPRRTAAALLCHNPEAANFLNEIHRKWDFENDCPLPNGVIRQPDLLGRSKLVWKKTGDDYLPL